MYIFQLQFLHSDKAKDHLHKATKSDLMLTGKYNKKFY